MKRLADISIATLLLVLAAPVLVVLAVAIRVTSPGPVLYGGVRLARHGGSFRMLKFRSMVPDAERLGGPSTAGNDSRLTPIGRWMRRYKLDELPQLINVVKGDMSLVGPRPEVLSEKAAYCGAYAEILRLRPGITDWASLWNSHEERVLAGAPDPHQAYKELIQPTKLALQLKYARERSLRIDLEILACTAVKALWREWVPPRLQPYGQPRRADAARPA